MPAHWQALEEIPLSEFRVGVLNIMMLKPLSHRGLAELENRRQTVQACFLYRQIVQEEGVWTHTTTHFGLKWLFKMYLTRMPLCTTYFGGKILDSFSMWHGMELLTKRQAYCKWWGKIIWLEERTLIKVSSPKSENCILFTVLILTYDFTPPVKHKNREGWLICEEIVQTGHYELDHLIHWLAHKSAVTSLMNTTGRWL